jgi:hypothetical protein
MGHIARNCPHAKYQIIKGKHKRHHDHAAKDNEPVQKKEK